MRKPFRHSMLNQTGDVIPCHTRSWKNLRFIPVVLIPNAHRKLRPPQRAYSFVGRTRPNGNTHRDAKKPHILSGHGKNRLVRWQYSV